MKNSRVVAWTIGIMIFASVTVAYASVIGTNPPARSLTADRIAQLPTAEQHAWSVYLKRSARQRQADKYFLKAELKHARLAQPVEAPLGPGARSIPLDRAPSWYASDEARHIADAIVSFQTPAGGWGKNLDVSKGPRRPGESFVPNNLSRFAAADDYDTPREPNWHYVGTIDNDATTTELIFLAKTVRALGTRDGAPYAASFLRGMDYLFRAQFPNGGWPQVWPLEGGYHDAITYNDGALVEVMDIMRRVADGADEFAFVPQNVRQRAAASFARGVDCILATQIQADGKRTVWPQQVDPLSLQPVSGRNFEPPVACAIESSSILLLLMNDLPQPDVQQQASIRAAAEWYQNTAIYGQSWIRTAHGRRLVATEGAGPIWARFYQFVTDRPVFGDRNKSIYDSVNEISEERQNGYAWFSSDPGNALRQFEQWNKEHPEFK